MGVLGIGRSAGSAGIGSTAGIGSVPLGRRQVLLGGAALGGSAAMALADVRTAHAAGMRGEPFQLGVASGDPLPGAVVIWTRLVRDPFDAASLGQRAIPVRWQVATDQAFTRVVRAGNTVARPEWAHSVHVDVHGLAPATEYYYRFRADAHLSPVGRTRTAPAAGSRPDRLHLGVVNCQDWQNGYWPAFDGVAAERFDVVVHLGDYIYEYDPLSAYPDRQHNPPQTPGLDQLVTLADYRDRHALYKTDPSLQAAHASAPWILTWDDHETENDYADDIDEAGDVGPARQSVEQALAQRAASYQAYYEHLPLRPVPTRGSPDYQIYRRFDLGDLARINVLDTRQYRTDQPGAFGPERLGRENTGGTMTGDPQEQWLRDGLTSSSAVWNVMAQQTLMARTRFPAATPDADGERFTANLDQWDGYQPARARLLGFLDQARIVNPIVLTGDIHSSWFSDLKLDFDDPASATVASEYVATSISSDFPIAFDAPIKAANPTLNPHVKYFDGSLRGYLRCDVTRERWVTEARTVPTITTRTQPVTTTARFATAAGTPGVVPA